MTNYSEWHRYQGRVRRLLGPMIIAYVKDLHGYKSTYGLTAKIELADGIGGRIVPNQFRRMERGLQMVSARRWALLTKKHSEVKLIPELLLWEVFDAAARRKAFSLTPEILTNAGKEILFQRGVHNEWERRKHAHEITKSLLSHEPFESLAILLHLLREKPPQIDSYDRVMVATAAMIAAFHLAHFSPVFENCHRFLSFIVEHFLADDENLLLIGDIDTYVDDIVAHRTCVVLLYAMGLLNAGFSAQREVLHAIIGTLGEEPLVVLYNAWNERPSGIGPDAPIYALLRRIQFPDTDKNLPVRIPYREHLEGFRFGNALEGVLNEFQVQERATP